MRKYFIPFIISSLIATNGLADDLDSLGTIPTMIESSDVDTLAEQIKELRGEIEKIKYELSSLKQKMLIRKALLLISQILKQKILLHLRWIQMSNSKIVIIY